MVTQMFSQSTAVPIPDHNIFSSLAMEEALFQGAPPLPRLDTGDAFDRTLQQWVAGPSVEGGHVTEQRGSRSGAVSSQAARLPSGDLDFFGQLAYGDLHSAPVLPLRLDFSNPLQQQQQQHWLPSSQPISSSQADPYSRGSTFSQPLLAEEGLGAVRHGLPPVSAAGTGAWAQPLHGGDLTASGLQIEQPVSTQLPHPSARLAQPNRDSSPQASSASPPKERGSPNNDVSRNNLGVASSTTSQQSLLQPDADKQGAILPPLPAAEMDVGAAKNAWPKRKRATTSEESREKERARNRRAQKRFREREKERQEQRQSALETLEAQLAALTRKNEALQERNAALEAAAAIKAEEARFQACPATWDPELFMELEVGDPTSLLPQLSVGGPPRQLSREDLGKLSFGEHARLYRAYVDALRALLGSDYSPGREQRIVELCQELCMLNLAVAMTKPAEFAAFQTSRLDQVAADAAPKPVQPPTSIWRRCLEGLRLSKDQKQSLLQERRTFLGRLGPLLKQRWQLHRLIAHSFPGQDAATDQRSHRAKAMEAVEKLRENLKQEQVMLVQTMCATFQQHLAPQQTAVNIVLAYPFHPDVPMLVDIIALETPGEPTAAEILGVDKIPPN